MKTMLLIISILSTGCFFSQSQKSKPTKKDYFKATIFYDEGNLDSLKLDHYVSTDNGSLPDLIRDLPRNKYSFKVRKGEYHTIWITNDSIHKGLFFVGTDTKEKFEIYLNLMDPDILNIYWNEEKGTYYISRMNYEELMESFKIQED